MLIQDSTGFRVLECSQQEGPILLPIKTALTHRIKPVPNSVALYIRGPLMLSGCRGPALSCSCLDWVAVEELH